MNERDKELAVKCRLLAKHTGGIYTDSLQEFADLIRADERERLEGSIAELVPVVNNPILQNKPAAFWIESFTQIVRGNT